MSPAWFVFPRDDRGRAAERGRKMLESDQMDLQKLTFFTEGNTFTGSKTKDAEAGKLLRYLARPNFETGKLDVFAWTEDLCFEKSSQRQESGFSLDESGLEAARSWLGELFQAL